MTENKRDTDMVADLVFGFVNDAAFWVGVCVGVLLCWVVL